MQDLAGLKIKEGKKKNRDGSYRETTKLLGHTTVRRVRELQKIQGEKVSLALVMGDSLELAGLGGIGTQQPERPPGAYRNPRSLPGLQEELSRKIPGTCCFW